jgi:hypothetical protein
MVDLRAMTNEQMIETLVNAMIVRIDRARANRDPDAIARIEDAVRRASAEIRGAA